MFSLAQQHNFISSFLPLYGDGEIYEDMMRRLKGFYAIIIMPGERKEDGLDG